ncbi:MAG: hypothetical protein WBK55_07150 [Alphaproteobacteria bacterium]
MVIPAFAAEKEPEVAVETSKRTRFAVELLRKRCLTYFSDRTGLVKLLDSHYERPPESETRGMLDFLHADSGDVWSAVMSPTVSYTIVSETGGNCHVITEQSDSALLHKHVKNLAADVRDSRSFNVVDYKGVPENVGPVKTSEFVVKAPDGGIILTVRATTKDDSKTELAEGVLSVFKPVK